MKVEVYQKRVIDGGYDYQTLTTQKTNNFVGVIEVDSIDDNMAVIDGNHWALRDALIKFATKE
jgi:hypothetical protein